MQRLRGLLQSNEFRVLSNWVHIGILIEHVQSEAAS
jgi:hypothetical protein